MALGGLLLLTAIAYSPIFHGGFVRWDDQFYVEENKLLLEPGGLAKIWNPISKEAPQYYPLLFSSYWIEYQLWGLNAAGYHTVNVALHLANTSLVAVLVRALGVGPWIALGSAAVFALHPVQVASVAWIAERKNTLSGFFYLVTFLLYLRHRRRGDRRSYALALAAFSAALLSKSQTATLPISLALADLALQSLGRLRRIPARTLAARLIPMLALCLLSGLLTIYFEQEAHTPRFALLDRLLIAANAAWFYAGTFLAPVHLSPIYRSWQVRATEPFWWLALGGWVGVGILLSRIRGWIDPLLGWGLAQFYVVLLPVLGFISFNFQTYSFVADHFLYLSCIGAGVALALLFGKTLQRWAPEPHLRRAPILAACAVLLALAAQTHFEAREWGDNASFWRRVRDRDPGGFLGPYNLGNHYRLKGQWKDAVPFYREAAAARPNVDYPFRRYLDALRQAEGPEAAIAACDQRLRGTPNFGPALFERARSLEALGRKDEARQDFDRARRLGYP